MEDEVNAREAAELESKTLVSTTRICVLEECAVGRKKLWERKWQS